MNKPASYSADGRAEGLFPERYHAIDGWRGIAALAVVIHHTTSYPTGGIGVLMFFVISGYCITCAIESGFRKGLSLREFIKRRIHRIYPPYYFAILFYCATRFVKWRLTGVNDINLSWVGWIQTLTLTQWLTLLFEPSTSPVNNPTLLVSVIWSLNYEEQFYFVTGLLFFCFSVRRFPAVILASGLAALVWAMVFQVLYRGLFFEFWSDFVLGAAVFFRLCRANATYRWLIDASLGLLLIIWVVILLVGPARLGLDSVKVLDQVILSGFALVLIAMRRFDGRLKSSVLGHCLAFLGKISYSLYLVHQFNLALCIAVVNALGGRYLPIWAHVILQICCHIVIATVFWYFCERPFLNKPLTRAKPAQDQ